MGKNDFTMVETSRLQEVFATAKSGDVEVQVNYKLDGNNVKRIDCSAFKLSQAADATEMREACGYASMIEDGSKNFSVGCGVCSVTLTSVFEQIFSEVNKRVTGK